MKKKSENYKVFVSIASSLAMMFIFLILIVISVSYTSFSIFPADIADNSVLQNSDLIDFCNQACNQEGGKYISSVNTAGIKECKCKSFKIAGEIYNKTQDIESESHFIITSTTSKEIKVKTEETCHVIDQNESNSFSVQWDSPHFFIVKCNANRDYNFINANPKTFGYKEDIVVDEDNVSIEKDRIKRMTIPLLILFVSVIFALLILNRLEFTMEDFKELVVTKNQENPLKVLIAILFVIALIIILFRIYL